MSSFGLCGCMHMCQHVDIHSHERVYMYSPPPHTHTHSKAEDRLGTIRGVGMCVVYGDRWSCFCPSTLCGFWGLKLRLPGLCGNHLLPTYLLTYHAGPFFLFSFLVESH